MRQYGAVGEGCTRRLAVVRAVFIAVKENSASPVRGNVVSLLYIGDKRSVRGWRIVAQRGINRR